jgi:hypothetical protein
MYIEVYVCVHAYIVVCVYMFVSSGHQEPYSSTGCHLLVFSKEDIPGFKSSLPQLSNYQKMSVSSGC